MTNSTLIDSKPELKYTICFCKVKDKVLMIHRYKEPNKDLWNGLGGKLEPGETAKDSIKREMQEEAGINLNQANELFFAGIVTWKHGDNPEQKRGMYAFVAEFPDDFEINKNSLDTSEGVLEWKDIDWVCNVNNNEVVDNIPHFLDPMLKKEEPGEYFFVYNKNEFIQMIKKALPSYISL